MMISFHDKAWQDVTTPTLVVNPDVARANIRSMADKARQNHVKFRPHFKTHQSAHVAQWFRDEGITAITVSSVSMAKQFAAAGWQDITIAFPVNVRELKDIDALAQQVTLSVILEREEVARVLAENLSTTVKVWIKTDTGYKRSGVVWNDDKSMTQLAKTITAQQHLHFEGLLTHAGHSYRARGREEILSIYTETVFRLQHAKQTLERAGLEVKVSLGDTPSCSVAETFTGIDEIRPGNFVFYDLQQFVIGSCREEQLALAVACPVVAIYPERGEIILYGGAVHLSKDFAEVDGVKQFGSVANLEKRGWRLLRDCYVSAVSQEHGIVKASRELLRTTRVSDLLFVIPAHACLAVNNLEGFRTQRGERF
jgi:D-serine deaminase-like pyridoxal phosphate-dependent protein